MQIIKRGTNVALAIALTATVALAADHRREFRYTAPPGAHVAISNESGPVTVRPSSGRQVLIVATTHSENVEVDSAQRGGRIEASTHFLKPVSGDEARVEYEVSIPADAHVTVRAPNGPIQVERLRGDLRLEGEAARVEVRDITKAHIDVRTMNGPVVLQNITDAHVNVTTVSGDVQLNSVTGPSVVISSTKGQIRVNGDFAGGGTYQFTNGSGEIELTVPTTASVDLRANSARGTVENELTLTPDPHRKSLLQGSSVLGTSNAGTSSVTVRSLSGRIRVKKQ